MDRRVLQKILETAELSPEDIVIEVGPGLGVLTEALIARAKRVIAVELDRGLALALRQALPRAEVIEGDILSFTPLQLLGASLPYKVVANIPYNITSPLLRHFLEAELPPRLMVIMVQREVGEAIVAKPGDLGLLALSVQFYSRPRLVARVPARSFYPPPQVGSALLRLEVYDQPAVAVQDRAAFFRIIRAGFSAPRKQLHNSLAQGLKLESETASQLLQEAGIDPRRRAETLSLEEWSQVYHDFSAQEVAIAS